MNTKAYYFRKGEDHCYKIESHLAWMIENGIKEMDVYLAKRETQSDCFYCKHFNEIGEKSEGGCGKSCEAYKPKNGKSGACVHLGNMYEQTDKCYTLNLDSYIIKDNQP